ncbi:MAG: hypothetical protein JKY84_14790 [Emcibacteraceae bacterium]|nr:hypothetical protein [Emcibacteraceae bacterium]
MRFSSLPFLLILFILSSCGFQSAPYSASTPFIVTDNNISVTSVEVGNHDPFFKHPIQYLEQVIIEGNYTEKKGSQITSANKLFAIETNLERMPSDPLAGATQKTLYCGLISKQSVFVKIMTGPQTGDRLLCFRDADNDGKFDWVYNAVGALKDPMTVFVVNREAVTLKAKLPYRKLLKAEKDNIGSVWFQIRSPMMASKYIDFYIGGKKDKQVITNRPLPNLKKNDNAIFYLGGAQIELLSIEGKQVKLRLEKPIDTRRKIGIVKTIVTRTY